MCTGFTIRKSGGRSVEAGQGKELSSISSYEPKLKPPWGAATAVRAIHQLVLIKLTIRLEGVLAGRIDGSGSISLLLVIVGEEFWVSAQAKGDMTKTHCP